MFRIAAQYFAGIFMAIKYFFAFLHERHIVFYLFSLNLMLYLMDFEWVGVAWDYQRNTFGWF